VSSLEERFRTVLYLIGGLCVGYYIATFLLTKYGYPSILLVLGVLFLLMGIIESLIEREV